MHLHPPLSGFPFVLLTTVVLLEVWSVVFPARRPGRAILINLSLAVIFSTATFFSGYFAAETANRTFRVPDEALTAHITAGRILLLSLFPCLGLLGILERGPLNPAVFRVLYLITLALAYGSSIYAGYLGGELVFTHGAGVNSPCPTP